MNLTNFFRVRRDLGARQPNEVDRRFAEDAAEVVDDLCEQLQVLREICAQMIKETDLDVLIRLKTENIKLRRAIERWVQLGEDLFDEAQRAADQAGLRA